MDIHQVSLAGPTWDKGFWRNTPTLNSPKSSLYNLYSYEEKGFLNLESGFYMPVNVVSLSLCSVVSSIVSIVTFELLSVFFI